MKNIDKKHLEYTAKEASERLDYALVMLKDADREQKIRVHVSEASLVISKTLAKTYIKESFERMNHEAQRVANGDIYYMESYKPAFSIHTTISGVWIVARPETERTAENKAKHAQMQVHRDAIWGEEE